MKLTSGWTVVFCGMMVGCGYEGPGIHGELVSNGVAVEYETYHSNPSLFARMQGVDGVAMRLAIESKTIYLVPDGYFPEEWEDQVPLGNYPQIDWTDIVEQFRGILFNDKDNDDRDYVLRVLENIKDALLSYTPASAKSALMSETSEPVPETSEPVPEITDEQADSWLKASGAPYASIGGGEGRPGESPKNRGVRPQLREEGYEFKQILELFFMHAFFTGYNHSGTITQTFKRPKGGSEADWKPFDRYETCNHGACPMRKKEMKRYEICNSGIVSDWYAIDGECHGDWMVNHLCNNDTLMQIANAKGQWKGTSCGGRRGIKPHCGDWLP